MMQTSYIIKQKTESVLYRNIKTVNSLVVQWLRLCAPSVGGLGSIPGQGTRSHMPQLKILCAATKSQRSQINK